MSVYIIRNAALGVLRVNSAFFGATCTAGTMVGGSDSACDAKSYLPGG